MPPADLTTLILRSGGRFSDGKGELCNPTCFDAPPKLAPLTSKTAVLAHPFFTHCKQQPEQGGEEKIIYHNPSVGEKKGERTSREKQSRKAPQFISSLLTQLGGPEPDAGLWCGWLAVSSFSLFFSPLFFQHAIIHRSVVCSAAKPKKNLEKGGPQARHPRCTPPIRTRGLAGKPKESRDPQPHLPSPWPAK